MTKPAEVPDLDALAQEWKDDPEADCCMAETMVRLTRHPKRIHMMCTRPDQHAMPHAAEGVGRILAAWNDR